MIPAGYLAKQVVSNPDWLNAAAVKDIYSVSGCISVPFADYIPFWQHNGFGLFDSPEIILDIALSHHIDLSRCKFFYYELYDLQFEPESQEWSQVQPCEDFPTNVKPPNTAILQGYDVVTQGSSFMMECSPLSCNSLAATLATNAHCLFESLPQAIAAVESGAFQNSEPGQIKIVACYTLA